MATQEVTPVPRSSPPEDGGERQVLTGLLDFLRATVVKKVAGLTDDQAFAAPVAPGRQHTRGVRYSRRRTDASIPGRTNFGQDPCAAAQ